jgi:hypothetical protein
MKKLLRIIVVLLLLLVMFAVVFPQAQYYAPALHRAITDVRAKIKLPESAEAVAALASKPPAAVAAAASSAPAPASAPAAPPTVSMLGSDSNPVVVKLADTSPSPDQAAEREKDREIQRSIARSAARLASIAKIQNLLAVIQSFISFLMLVVFCMLVENIRKLANASARSAEVAKTSAEASARKGDGRYAKRHGPRKYPPHFYHKR